MVLGSEWIFFVHLLGGFDGANAPVPPTGEYLCIGRIFPLRVAVKQFIS